MSPITWIGISGFMCDIVDDNKIQMPILKYDFFHYTELKCILVYVQTVYTHNE